MVSSRMFQVCWKEWVACNCWPEAALVLTGEFGLHRLRCMPAQVCWLTDWAPLPRMCGVITAPSETGPSRSLDLVKLC